MRTGSKTEEPDIVTKNTRAADPAGARAVALAPPGRDAPIQLRPGRATEDSRPAPLAFASPSGHALPDRLRAGVEHLSGVAMSDVRVHYRSSLPARVHAQAFAQGTTIHLAPGHEHHLPHEAWHTAQQKQGRVPTTDRLHGAALNDDPALEREADVMGARAASLSLATPSAESAALRPSTGGPRVTDGSSAPIQRSGDFTRLMPAHETTGAPIYNSKGVPKSDYTYHHVVPENYIASVYAKVKDLIAALDNPQSPAAQTAQIKRDAFVQKGLAWWKIVSAREMAYYVNKGAQDLPVPVSVSEAEMLEIVNMPQNTVDARGAALIALVHRKTRAAFEARVEALLQNVDEYSIRSGKSSAPALKALLSPYLSVHDAARLLNADIHNDLDRRTPAARARNFIKVVHEVARLVPDEAVTMHFHYNKFTDWGDKALLSIAQTHGLTNTEAPDAQHKKMMEWIPGNIHQGPKSDLRLQGNSKYKTGVTKPQQAPKGAARGFDPTLDDGGGNFEWSVQKIFDPQHFTDILTMKTLLEDLDNDPTQVDKLGQLFEVMSTLYDRGLTLFKDTQGKWEEDDSIGKWRFKQ